MNWTSSAYRSARQYC